VVAGVSFLQDTASEMLYPVLPLFVVGVLAAPPAALGVIEGVAETAAAVAKVGAGARADRVRRRPMIGAGYTMSAVAKPAIGLAMAWPMVLVARVADRLGKGIRGAPRDALIADETTPTDRGRAFGFHRAADTAGAVVGPLLGLALYHLVGERLRPLFFLAFIPAIASAALVLLVRERPHPRPAAGATPFDPRRLGEGYWRAIAPLIVFACLNFTDALVLLRADELGLGFSGVVLAYVLYNVVYAALSYPAGRWSDRRQRSQVFAVGLVVFAIAYTGLGLATSSGWVWVLLPLYGAFTALTDGVGKAWISDVVPTDLRGTGLGTYGALSGLGMLVAGLWAGLVWGDDGSLPFLVAGPLALVVAAVVARSPRARQTPVSSRQRCG
jgi:MFS family permease